MSVLDTAEMRMMSPEPVPRRVRLRQAGLMMPLDAQFAESAWLEKEIRKNLKGLEYGA